MTDVTILVSSCDKYEDAWEPFLKLLKIQWPTCPYQIALSTENKVYHGSQLNVKTLCTNSTLSWSSRLKNTLKQIDTEYVLFFLEDFFLIEKVETDVFEAALNLIRARKDICLIEFPSIEANYCKINKEEYMNLGNKIKKLRKQNNLTQENLAEMLGVSYQAISRWENNITSPDISTLPILANIFDVTVDYLLDVNILKNEETINKIYDEYYNLSIDNKLD